MQPIVEQSAGLPAATIAIQRPLLQRQAGSCSALSRPFSRSANVSVVALDKEVYVHACTAGFASHT